MRHHFGSWNCPCVIIGPKTCARDAVARSLKCDGKIIRWPFIDWFTGKLHVMSLHVSLDLVYQVLCLSSRRVSPVVNPLMFEMEPCCPSKSNCVVDVECTTLHDVMRDFPGCASTCLQGRTSCPPRYVMLHGISTMLHNTLDARDRSFVTRSLSKCCRCRGFLCQLLCRCSPVLVLLTCFYFYVAKSDPVSVVPKSAATWIQGWSGSSSEQIQPYVVWSKSFDQASKRISSDAGSGQPSAL